MVAGVTDSLTRSPPGAAAARDVDESGGRGAMIALLALLPLTTVKAAVSAATTPTKEAADAACLAEFKLCAAHCASDDSGVQHERSCHTGCARTSALCQAASVAPLAAAKPADTAIASSDFAFTDVNGERFLPFGFYQYTVTKDLDKRLPGEEAMHGEPALLATTRPILC